MTRNEAIDRIREHMAIHKLNEPRAVKITEALNMAIEVLKAEQPRIMRLPEAMGIYDPVFAEFKKMDGDTFTKWVDAVISDDARHVKVTDLYCIIPTIRDMEFDFNLYNKRFRFWSKKPTDEQMASEPWN